MSKFHSTVSRRNFMKGLGLAGAGLGAAAAAAPVFHDLDELASAPAANWHHPWYVKEREAYDPTCETDWDMIQPWKRGPTNPKRTTWYVENNTKRRAAGDAYKGQDRYDLKYDALRTAASYNQESAEWTGYEVTSPADRDFAPLQGTPEENAHIIRAGFHLLGSPETHFLGLDSKSVKMITKDQVRFENTPEPYRDDDRTYVIPDTCKTFVTVLGRKEISLTRRGMGEAYGYSSSTMVMRNCQKFIKGLGYHAVQAREATNSSIAILAGGAELSRLDHAVNPRYGAAIKKHGILLTNMPLPAEKPIDAGIFKFCRTCKVCAELCHVQDNLALTMDTEPVWELPSRLPPADGNTFDYKRPGVKKWFIDYAYCGCNIHCWRNCTFNQLDAATAHAFVKAMVATTPIFNGFFTQMDRAFGYGARTYEETIAGTKEWWARDLTTWKWDTIPAGDNLP